MKTLQTPPSYPSAPNNFNQFGRSFSSLNFKWRRKRLWLTSLFSLSMIILSAIDMALRNRLSSSYNASNRLIFACCGLPLCLTLIFCYTWIAIKEYNLLDTIIKRERIRFFWGGISCASASFIITTVNLVMSVTEQTTTILSVSSWVSLGLCMLIGTGLIVLISIYEFCVGWDVFYHKNKEILIKEHLARQQSLKIEEREDEEKELW